MKIELKGMTIEKVSEGYVNNLEDGVSGMAGKLNIRPKYQREFVYNPDQRDAVIKSVMNGLPLNTMYWSDNEDGSFEVMDGQQRTISICEFINGGFSVNYRFFHNLDEEEKKKFLEYKLMVYVCKGTNKEKLEWFKTINIAGAELTKQELRNAIYTGKWLTDAKKYFSKTNCPAFNLAKEYLKGNPIRQEYLETAISWISEDIEDYMSKNQINENSNELWLHFQNVINWTKVVFKNYRKEIKGVNLGKLYNEFKDKSIDSEAIELEITKLMQDEDVTNKSGIFYFVLNRDQKHLNIRKFSENQKREAYEKQNGICPVCGKRFEINEMEADHITPWHEGGKTSNENCQMLCKHDNRIKSGR